MIDDLLSSPRSIFMDAYRWQVRGNLFQQDLFCLMAAIFEYPLNYSVTDVIYDLKCKLQNKART